jgi:DivIVA domain-containing protein
MWFLAVLVVLVMGGIAVVAAGRGAPMSEVEHDRLAVDLPADRPVTAEDLRRVRFPLALRGYRMADVDALLDRLAQEREAAEVRGDDQTA